MQRNHFADEGPYNQSHGFPDSHVWMWELDHKEGLGPKNLMFLNCGAGEDSSEVLGQQGEQINES